ncbi:MAG TPA: bifunctional phosphopantothenoylcysteine decarboxylase/phosphopantothenate--cysteine ligase CoaBC [Cryomorphaceae bacterium]|nr:bifunctional phosphopantothenoylcysteine decarboxylase/phosphopantothenate--cysteine ligase CoaBC [Cryomorphaceae bacterium]
MSLLRGKRILLGVSGSIAAYKSAFLVREFVKQGAEVRVIITPFAAEFVTPLTLGTLSGNPVAGLLVREPKEEGMWHNHVELGQWADFMVIAPATAHTLAKMAGGQSDNLLLTTYLSAPCPVYFAPAMDLDMIAHESTEENIAKLRERGNIEIPSESGELASGLVGKGRMAEPEHIARFIEEHLAKNAPLRDKKVLVTAGPTQEDIDPVRYIGNRSTGKMGYALAEVAARLGAQVTLISGPSPLEPPKDVHTVSVRSAQDMYEAALEVFAETDIAVLAAAVADYRPKVSADSKIKKSDAAMTIELEPTKDILKTLGEIKTERQITVGFALETDNELENAKGKLKAKNCDLIVLNSMRHEGAGFGHDTNRVTLISRNKSRDLQLKPKVEVARDIWTFVLENFLDNQPK